MRPFCLTFCCLAAGIVGACSGAHEPAKEQAVVVSQPAAKPPLLLDVPAVLGASIDELARRLGPMRPVPEQLNDPSLAMRRSSGIAFDSAGAFQHHGLTVVATFSTHTRQVGDLLVVGKDEQQLMQQARLQDNASNYLLLPAFETNNTDRFLGLWVIATTRLN